MQAVAIAWHVYEIARKTQSVEKSAFLLGLIGLAQFLPLLVFSMIGGQTADKKDRKSIIMTFLGVEVLLSGILLVSIYSQQNIALFLIFSVAIGFGLVRAFLPSAMTALGPNLVPPEELPNAIAWNSLGFQFATILGPAIGGLVYALGAQYVYLSCLLLQALAFFIITITSTPKQIVKHENPSPFFLIKEGLKFVAKNKIVLGAISLDLAVVLLAGAVALLPVFAKDILHVGPTEMGLMRASPGIGAAIIALTLAINPLRRRVGMAMFAAVIVFGASIVGFGLSRNFWLSVFFLALSGAADMISVFVRQSLVQIATPDEMRGRVAAVSMIFISASNELGEFETGVMARILGPVKAVVFGGIGAIITAFIWMGLFEPLRRADGFESTDMGEKSE